MKISQQLSVALFLTASLFRYHYTFSKQEKAAAVFFKFGNQTKFVRSFRLEVRLARKSNENRSIKRATISV